MDWLGSGFWWCVPVVLDEGAGAGIDWEMSEEDVSPR